MDDIKKKYLLKEAKDCIKAGEFRKAFGLLNEISSPDDDFTFQAKYASLFKLIPPDELELKNIRIALLATSTVSHFTDILKYWLAKAGMAAEIYGSEYNTVHQTILDSSSPLYEFRPDVAMIFINYRDVKCDVPPGSSFEKVQGAVTAAVDSFTSLWAPLQRYCKCHILQNNADLPYHRVSGHYDGTALWGHLNVLRQFNLALARAAGSGVTIFDIDYISSAYGKKRWHDERYWYHSKHSFSLDAAGLVAYDATRVIGSIKGYSKKCVIVDLDNTLWGGVVGDDGLEGIVLGNGPEGEAFVAFQRFLLELKKRGIILTVCSKNEEDLAKEPFLRHPDMQIKLDDIAVFKANWADKVSNIREIASTLNIGLDSVVFIDDNPVERELVRGLLPMVSVPDLPQDPVNYVPALSSFSYFEAVSFSEEDKIRNELYKNNITRSEFQKQFTNLPEFLRSLEMEMDVRNFDSLDLPRIAQLINKSNQFHLTTTRYSEVEIKAASADENRICRSFRLRDRFGDNGLISAVILEKTKEQALIIGTWVMSCRVLSRGAEEFICSEIISLAKEAGVKRIIGKYIPTKKNKLVEFLYRRLGFKMVRQEGGITFWELALGGDIPPYVAYIKRVKCPGRPHIKETI